MNSIRRRIKPTPSGTSPGSPARKPRLVLQFVKMLQTGVDAYPNAVQSANITCTGILAHDSALKGGEIVHLPEWTLS
jgi:hypothetical protein